MTEEKPKGKVAEVKSEANEKSTKSAFFMFLEEHDKGITLVLTLLIALIFAGIVYSAVADNINTGSEGPELTNAEELESYPLPEGATQSDINNDRLTLAGAYFREQNYDRALSLLGEVVDADEMQEDWSNRLYADIYYATDNPSAAEYYSKVLAAHEDEFLALGEEGDVTGYYELAILNERSGNADEAKVYYQKIVDYLVVAEEEYELFEHERSIYDLALTALESM